MKIYLTAIVCFVLFVNCFGQTGNQQQKKDDLNSCILSSNLDDYKDSLIQNPKIMKIILDDNDSCVIQLLDEIKFNIYQNKNSVEYYDLLESISKISDGYISDLLVDISFDLFNNDYKRFSTFLHDHKEARLSQFLIEAWSLRVSEANDEKEELNGIKQAVMDNSSNSEIKNYLLHLHGKINPAIWD